MTSLVPSLPNHSRIPRFLQDTVPAGAIGRMGCSMLEVVDQALGDPAIILVVPQSSQNSALLSPHGPRHNSGGKGQAEPHHGGQGAPQTARKANRTAKAAIRKWGWLTPCDPGLAGAKSSPGRESLLEPWRSCRSSCKAARLGIRFPGVLAEFPSHKTGGFCHEDVGPVGFIWFLRQKDEFCLSPR